MKEIVIAGVFTVIGGAIGAIATYITGVKTVREQKFDTAANTFRNKMLFELPKFKHKDNFTKMRVSDLRESLRSIEAACLEFSFFLKYKNTQDVFRKKIMVINNIYLKMEDPSEAPQLQSYCSNFIYDLLVFSDWQGIKIMTKIQPHYWDRFKAKIKKICS